MIYFYKIDFYLISVNWDGDPLLAGVYMKS